MQNISPGDDGERPIAFISSFYLAEKDKDHRRDDPLWCLRQELAAIPLIDGRRAAWVAEQAERSLADPGRDSLEVVDRLVEVLRRSDLYVPILAGDWRTRRSDQDHGSAIPVQGKPTAVSYFEVELYAAAMYSKVSLPPYVLEGFNPGSRLKALLNNSTE